MLCRDLALWRPRIAATLVPSARRNRDVAHSTDAVTSRMPDKWKFPSFAAWDRIPRVPMARQRPPFAKRKLRLLMGDRICRPRPLLHTSGRLGDINPPVHVWPRSKIFQTDTRTEPSNHSRDTVFQRSPDQLHLVGQPQGRLRAKHLPEASSVSTTSAFLIAAPALPSVGHAGAGDAHRLDGLVLRDLLGRSPSSWPSESSPSTTLR